MDISLIIAKLHSLLYDKTYKFLATKQYYHSVSLLFGIFPHGQSVIPDNLEGQRQAVEGQKDQLCSLALVPIHHHYDKNRTQIGRTLETLHSLFPRRYKLAQPHVNSHNDDTPKLPVFVAVAASNSPVKNVFFAESFGVVGKTQQKERNSYEGSDLDASELLQKVEGVVVGIFERVGSEQKQSKQEPEVMTAARCHHAGQEVDRVDHDSADPIESLDQPFVYIFVPVSF